MVGISGRIGSAGGRESRFVKLGAQAREEAGTVLLESGRRKRKYWCSGDLRRDREEHKWRKRLSGPNLKQRLESQRSERD